MVNPRAVVLLRVPLQRRDRSTPPRGHSSPSDSSFVPGKGANTETAWPGALLNLRSPFTTSKRPELVIIATSGTRSAKSRSRNTFPIKWSSRPPPAPTITICGWELIAHGVRASGRDAPTARPHSAPHGRIVDASLPNWRGSIPAISTAKRNAFSRSFVSCSSTRTSLEPIAFLSSSEMESQSPTMKSASIPSDFNRA